MPPRTRIRRQLQRHAVALISLAVAISSLGYNTWRNEASEYNRNQRLISLEILRNLGELQMVVFHLHHDSDELGRAGARSGWALVLTIRDLARVLDGEAPEAAAALWQTWDDEWAGLGSRDASRDRVLEALESLRAEVHALLHNLD